MTLFEGGGATGRVLPALAGTVESLKFDGHGNLLASYYGGVTYYDFRRTEEEHQVRAAADCGVQVMPWLLLVYPMAPHPSYPLRALRSPTRPPKALDLPYPANCLAADASPDGCWFVAGAHDASVHIWRLVQGDERGVKVDEMTCGGESIVGGWVRVSGRVRVGGCGPAG